MKKILSLIFILCVSCSLEKSAVSNGIDIFFKGDLSVYQDKKIGLVINTTEGAKSISDSYSLRRSALINKIPHCTTIAAAHACIQAISSLKNNKISVNAIQDL